MGGEDERTGKPGTNTSGKVRSSMFWVPASEIKEITF